jgi:hypothetical protein
VVFASRVGALFGDIQDRMLEYDMIMYQLDWRRVSALGLDLVRKIRTGRPCFSGV